MNESTFRSQLIVDINAINMEPDAQITFKENGEVVDINIFNNARILICD